MLASQVSGDADVVMISKTKLDAEVASRGVL